MVRETLDKLAPDDAVLAAPRFKLEPQRNGPTMAQKLRFILKARKVPDLTRETAERSATIIDESMATLDRLVYKRGAINVHTGRTFHEVRNFKLYADAVMTELLEINKPAEPKAAKAAEAVS